MENNTDSPADERHLGQRLVDIVGSCWMTQATCAAAKLGIADLLEQAPRSSSDLAVELDCHPQSLHQLLRALCSLEICRERDDGTFEITAMGRLLGSQSPYSLQSWTIFWGESTWAIWGELYHAVKSGEDMQVLRTGMSLFELLQSDTQAAHVFNAGMREYTRLISAEAAYKYDFSGKLIADIGGGYGELLAAVLEAHPSARGILFDTEHAIEDARGPFTQRGLADRCEFVSGDFFESVPAGADLYLLKTVIHNWDDERASTILRTCRRAMGPDSRILLMERMMPERLQPTPRHQAFARGDLNMRVVFGARERTEAEFAELLSAAGFGSIRLWPAGSVFSYLEAAPQVD